MTIRFPWVNQIDWGDCYIDFEPWFITTKAMVTRVSYQPLDVRYSRTHYLIDGTNYHTPLPA